MILLKIVVCFLILIVVPELLGLLITKFMKQKDSLLDAFVIGYLLEFAILELLAVPMIFCKLKFTTLLYSWSSIIGILLILSITVNTSKFRIKNWMNGLKKIIKEMNVLSIIAIVLIAVQIIISIRYTHTDADDAFYVGTANTTLVTNKMYRVSAENGSYYGKFPARYILSPFSLYTAVIASIVKIHPTIIAHTVFPPIFIAIAYMIYTLLAMMLFKEDKKDVSIFLIFLSIIYIWGNFSIRTNFTFLLFRIWQGKAILANIILPSIWLIFLKCVKENENFIHWLTLWIVMLAACHVSSMGIALSSITLFRTSICFQY